MESSAEAAGAGLWAINRVCNNDHAKHNSAALADAGAASSESIAHMWSTISLNLASY